MMSFQMGHLLGVAQVIGDMRQNQNVRDSRVDLRSKVTDDPGNLHYLGCIGELAFSLLSGEPWTGAYLDDEARRQFKKERGQPDVGEKFQVRTRPNLTYDLPVYRKDPDDHVAVLALYEEKTGTVYFPGWYPISLAKRDEYWASFLPRPNYLIPQARLFPMEALLVTTS